MVVLAVVALGATLGAGDATGAARAKSSKWGAASAKRFTASGVMTGVLGGSVVIGERTVEIPDNARIMAVDGRVIEPGMSIPTSGVQVMGVVKKNKLIATMVLVSEPRSSADYSEETLPNVEADANRAR
jgi:hypothetical protein